MLHWISNYSLIRCTSCSCSTCSFGFSDLTNKNLQDFIKIYKALIKDIFLVAEANPENLSNRLWAEAQIRTIKSTLNMSTQLSSRTWPIRSVQVQLGSVAHPKSDVWKSLLTSEAARRCGSLGAILRTQHEFYVCMHYHNTPLLPQRDSLTSMSYMLFH